MSEPPLDSLQPARRSPSLAALRAWPWRETLRTLRQRFREDRLGVTASSLTFTTLISLVPLMTVTLAVFSAFPMFGRFHRLIESYLVQSLVPDSIAKPVLGALTQFAGQASRLGAAGLVVLVLTALALMLTIDRTLNDIWRVRKPRSMAQRVLVYWAAATLGPLLLGASLSLTSYALSASQGVVAALPGGVALALNTIEYLLLAFAMAGLFYYVPNTHVRWIHALAGGLFVSTGFELAKKALAWYLGAMPAYSMIYGAFAAVPIFLVWLYCGWVIVLLGAMLTAYAPSLQQQTRRVAGAPGWRFDLAIAVLRSLQAARVAAHRGSTLAQLSTAVDSEPVQVEPLVDLMVALDWVGRLDEPGSPRYVLLCDVERTPLAPLVERVLVDRVPTLARFWQQTGLGEMTVAAVIAD